MTDKLRAAWSARKAEIEGGEVSARPSYCCGVCPEIVGGGYDCTCRGNRNCPNFRHHLMPMIRSAFETAISCHEEVARKGRLEPCDKPAVALRWDYEDRPYPVCSFHSRGDMVTIVEMEEALK